MCDSRCAFEGFSLRMFEKRDEIATVKLAGSGDALVADAPNDSARGRLLVSTGQVADDRFPVGQTRVPRPQCGQHIGIGKVVRWLRRSSGRAKWVFMKASLA
ncbi:hypothetical protein [Caballeronia sordidicola]|uniref:hypothetical protein n=1 Tax=Caballeronia sordidicola TaxID=196367 RepID=UPI0004D0320F|nr:hypothetical protein [Caballeronia sordidicola]